MSNDKEWSNENEAVIKLMEDIGVVEEMEIKGTPVLSVPKGRTLQSVKKLVDEWRDKPERTKGTAILTTLQAFIDHANRFKAPGSAVFATQGSAPSLTSVLNYHAHQDPNWSDHRGVYKFPLSAEWLAWTGIDGQSLSQLAFGEFLENRIGDVLPPERLGNETKDQVAELGYSLASRTKLLTLSKGLQVNVDSKLVNQQNLSSGETKISFEEMHKDSNGEPLNVPGGFALGVPLFQGGGLFVVLVRLRYRASGGKLTWTVILHNTHKVIETAVNAAAEEVKAKTALPVFMGSPEA